MLNLNKYPTNCFSPAYQQIVCSLRADINDTEVNGRSPLQVLEGTEKLIKEELVRCVWFGQHIKKDKLYTDDGSRLEVLSPGWWNSEGGPDFKHAEILLEGKGLVKGNVEVHVFASDWMRHRHDKQNTYDSVCLHVVMWNDHEERHITNSKGELILQLTLSEYLDAEIDEIVDIIDVESYIKGKKVSPGYCKTAIEERKIDEQWIGRFLDYSGDERILQKAKRYGRWTERSTFEQTLYEAVMESLGYKNNKKPFLTLAAHVPLNTMQCIIPDDVSVREKKRYLQSLLFNMAGLFPSPEKHDTHDEETSAYIKSIEHAWKRIRIEAGKIPLSKKEWSYAGIRPANFPERRIAAISNILSECMPAGIFRRLLSAFQKGKNGEADRGSVRSVINDILSIFLEAEDDYWSYHYTIGGKKLGRVQKLLGRERASVILINVIVPLMLVYARKQNDVELEKLLHAVYGTCKPLPATSVIKFMNNRIFGRPKVSAGIVNSVRRQQGLYQIFKDFCENNTISCNKCAFYLFITKTGGSK